jgi:hypothetical protein
MDDDDDQYDRKDSQMVFASENHIRGRLDKKIPAGVVVGSEVVLGRLSGLDWPQAGLAV